MMCLRLEDVFLYMDCLKLEKAWAVKDVTETWRRFFIFELYDWIQKMIDFLMMWLKQEDASLFLNYLTKTSNMKVPSKFKL